MSKRTVLSVTILSLLTLLSLWVFFTDTPLSQNIKMPDSGKKSSKLLDEVKIKDLIITETKEGKKYWEILAEVGYYDSKLEKANLKNVKGNFYGDGVVVFSFAAPSALYDSITKEITLKEEAVAVNDKNVTIKAGEICWASRENKITAKDKVRILQRGKLMTVSDEAEFNTDFTYLKLKGNADSHVYK